MTQGFTELLQKTRLTVIEVDQAKGRIRVRGEADACSELSCGEQTLVVTDDGTGGLEALNPGDIIKVDASRADRIVVVRRAWDEIASPEI